MTVPKRFPKIFRLLLLALLCLVISGLAANSTFFKTVESRTVDYRFRLLGDQKNAASDIILVEIDDASIKDMAQLVGRWPWPRDIHATFLNYLHHAGAKLVVFDVMFTEAENAEHDQALADATKRAGNVVHAILLGDQNVGAPDPGLLERSSIPVPPVIPTSPSPDRRGIKDFFEADFPLKSLSESSRALGHIGFVLDPDGPWRRYLPLASYRPPANSGEELPRLIPALGLAAALALENVDPHSIRIENREIVAGSIHIPLDEDWRLPIWFNGPPGTYKSYRYSHVFLSQLATEQNENLEPSVFKDPSLFKDKVVIVGVTAAALHDVFTNPYSGGATEKGIGTMPGAEIHANVIDDLLHNRYVSKTPLWITWLLTLAVSILTLVVVFFTQLKVASFAALVVPVAYLPCVQIAFSRHRQLPVVATILAWALAVALGFAYQYWIEGAEKRKVSRIFSRYVSKDVYQQLLDNPAAAELGGKRSLITVLFSDLRGFTSISEKLPPEEMIAQLNEYFSAMVPIVFQYRGTVDKFVGDMIMALFNAPLPDPDHADHAVQCAIAMNQKLEQMNEVWRKQGRPELHSGVGINSGDVVVGNVGAESIRSYTVIGDNVNLGSRLESQCKEYKAEIIISEFTRTLLKHEYPTQELGDVLVKGKSRPVKIFRIFYEPDAVSKPKLVKEAAIP